MDLEAAHCICISCVQKQNLMSMRFFFFFYRYAIIYVEKVIVSKWDHKKQNIVFS